MDTITFSQVFAVISLLGVIIALILQRNTVPMSQIAELVEKLRDISERTPSPHDDNAVLLLEQAIDILKRLGLLAPDAQHEDTHALAQKVDAVRSTQNK